MERTTITNSRFQLQTGTLTTKTTPDKTDKTTIHQTLQFNQSNEYQYVTIILDTKTNKTLDLAFNDNPKRIRELKNTLKILQKYEEYL